MRFHIISIAHKDQRYETVGDWQVTPTKDNEKVLTITVSNTGNWKYDALVGVHELVEAILCLDRGVSQEDVDKFDREFEAKRHPGNDNEPGDDPEAPYKKEHFFATNIERLLSAELGVDWNEYEQTLNTL